MGGFADREAVSGSIISFPMMLCRLITSGYDYPPETCMDAGSSACTDDGEERSSRMPITYETVKAIIDKQATALKEALDASTGAQCGVAVAFYYPGNSVIPSFYCYGSANSAGDPVTKTTIFAIGSVTKTFTATLLANAVLATGSKVALNQTVTDYLPANVKPSTTLQKITLLEVATHTSGMPESVSSVGKDAGVSLFQKAPSTPPEDLVSYWQDYVANSGANPPSFSPGTCWLYSDLGFITLGYAVVAANSGYTSYADLLSTVITGPLGMSNTAATIAQGATVAQGHYNKQLVPISGATDLKSTVQDMYTWLEQNLQAQNAGNPSQLQQALAMTTTRQLSSLPNCGEQTSGPDMGLAWQLADKNASVPTIIWKDGAVSAGGCSCWLGMIPATDSVGPMGVAILANGWVDDLGGVSVEADPYGHAILTQIAASA
jgi:CubicO group peptidase (beta-lactamase class C family)